MAGSALAYSSDVQQSNDTTPTEDSDTDAPEDDNTLKSGVPAGTTFDGTRCPDPEWHIPEATITTC